MNHSPLKLDPAAFLCQRMSLFQSVATETSQCPQARPRQTGKPQTAKLRHQSEELSRQTAQQPRQTGKPRYQTAELRHQSEERSHQRGNGRTPAPSRVPQHPLDLAAITPQAPLPNGVKRTIWHKSRHRTNVEGWFGRPATRTQVEAQRKAEWPRRCWRMCICDGSCSAGRWEGMSGV